MLFFKKTLLRGCIFVLKIEAAIRIISVSMRSAIIIRSLFSHVIIEKSGLNSHIFPAQSVKDNKIKCRNK